MPKVSKQSTQVQDHGPVEEWSGDVDGYTINIVHFKQEMDDAPMLKGLPDDRCQCPHWGYILKGSVTFRYADREETFEEGDAFYTPPGHIATHSADSEYLQFSPTDELKVVEETIMKNMQEMQGA